MLNSLFDQSLNLFFVRPSQYACLTLALVLGGCGSDAGQFVLPDLPVDGGTITPPTGPDGTTIGEPNDSFAQALVVEFDMNGRAQLVGTVGSIGDIDVFLLGPVSAGDEIIVDADTPFSVLDVSVAIFDDAQRLVANNDDRSPDSNRFLDSFLDFVVRHGGETYYLAVSHSAFAEAGQFTGQYSITVDVVAGGEVPLPIGQVLLLDFDGGEVDSPVLGTMEIDAFDAAAISPLFAGQTQTIKDAIRATMEENYNRFNVEIITTDDLPLPQGSTAISTIFFGGFSARTFGIAEGVDLNNIDFCDDAIIFVETFSPDQFDSAVSPAEIGIAIGNVASHEAGHLLGLNHVDDDRALMDDQSDTDVFLDDQNFMESPLSSDVMSLGTQDAVLLLNETVGPVNGSVQRRTKSMAKSFAFPARRYSNARLQAEVLKARSVSP